MSSTGKIASILEKYKQVIGHANKYYGINKEQFAKWISRHNLIQYSDHLSDETLRLDFGGYTVKIFETEEVDERLKEWENDPHVGKCIPYSLNFIFVEEINTYGHEYSYYWTDKGTIPSNKFIYPHPLIGTPFECNLWEEGGEVSKEFVCNPLDEKELNKLEERRPGSYKVLQRFKSKYNEIIRDLKEIGLRKKVQRDINPITAFADITITFNEG